MAYRHTVTPDAHKTWHVEMCMHNKCCRSFYVGMYVYQTQVAGPAPLGLASNAATCADFVSCMSKLAADDLLLLCPTRVINSNGKTEMAGTPHLRMSHIRADTPMMRSLIAAVY